MRGSKGKLLFKFHSSRNSGGKKGEEGGKELSSLSSASLGQSAEVLERLQNPRSPPGGGKGALSAPGQLNKAVCLCLLGAGEGLA